MVSPIMHFMIRTTQLYGLGPSQNFDEPLGFDDGSASSACGPEGVGRPLSRPRGVRRLNRCSSAVIFSSRPSAGLSAKLSAVSRKPMPRPARKDGTEPEAPVQQRRPGSWSSRRGVCWWIWRGGSTVLDDDGAGAFPEDEERSRPPSPPRKGSKIEEKQTPKTKARRAPQALASGAAAARGFARDSGRGVGGGDARAGGGVSSVSG